MKPFLKYYLLGILVFSGIALPIFRDAFVSTILFVVSTLIIISNTVKYNKKLQNVIIVWTVYCGAIMLMYSEIFEGFYIRHLLYILSSYIIVKYFGKLLFYYFEKYIYYFALISLFFFVWQLVNIESIYYIFDKIDLAHGTIKDGFIPSKSILIYTLHGDAINNGNMRNCGFAWEPGPFSIFIVFAIYFNLLRVNFKFKGNYRLLVLLITLGTTFSTTGILAFATIILEMVLLNYRGIKRIAFLIIGLSIILYAFLTLDFLFAKITSLYSSGNAEDILNQVKSTGEHASLGRFAGYTISWEEFKQRPFFGYAGASGQSYFANLSYGANMVSGLASIIGMYGLFGIIILVYFSIKSSIKIARVFDSGTRFGVLIILFIGLFGFHLEIMPIFYSILFYSLFSQQIVGKEKSIHRESSSIPSNLSITE